jgi:hypothetical protein
MGAVRRGALGWVIAVAVLVLPAGVARADTSSEGQAPVGSLDGAELTAPPGTVTIRGWSADPDAPDPAPETSHVHIYVDEVPMADVDTHVPRPDVEAVVPFAGPNAGFEIELFVKPSPAPHRVCAYGINRGPNAENTLLGCRDVAVPVAGPVLGAVDTVSETGGGFDVYGWVWDTSDQGAFLTADMDGTAVGASYEIGLPRPDVAAAIPGAPDGTGFRFTLVSPLPAGNICVHAGDVYFNTLADLGCIAFPPSSDAGSPSGSLDEVRAEVGRVVVRGWAVDPDLDAWSGQVHVYVDGQFFVGLPLDAARPDVAAVVPNATGTDGYEATLPARAGRHQICVYAVNRGRTGRNVTLGCRDVDVPSTSGGPEPFGSLDGTTLDPTGGSPDGVTVRGWATQPGYAPVQVRVLSVGSVFRSSENVFDVTGPTGVPRPDVPAAIPGAPPDTGYEIPVIPSGHVIDFRLTCAVARAPETGAEALLGCVSYVTRGGRTF